jgi:hypothetical protein
LIFHQKEVAKQELETSQTLLIDKLTRVIERGSISRYKVDHWEIEFDIDGVKQKIGGTGKATTCYGKVARKHGEGRGDIFLAKTNVTSIFPCGN